MKMNALVKTGVCRGEVVEVDAPQTAEDECLVRIRACGICAWDANTWQAEKESFGPGLTGHEIAGEIAEKGKRVRGWRVGDKVVIYGVRSCGTCHHCKRRNYRYCAQKKPIVNGFAEYVNVPGNRLLKMPHNISFAEASLLIDIVGTPLHALRRGDVSRKTTVAIWGLGPVGLGAVQGARALGARFVAGIEPLENRRDAAKKLGATLTINPEKENAVSRLKEATEGEGIHVCINAVAIDAVAQQAYDSLRLDGTLVLLTGEPTARGQLEKNVRGSWYFHIDEYEKNLRLLARRRLQLAPIISHTFALDQAPAAFNLRVNHPEQVLKVVITM